MATKKPAVRVHQQVVVPPPPVVAPPPPVNPLPEPIANPRQAALDAMQKGGATPPMYPMRPVPPGLGKFQRPYDGQPFQRGWGQPMKGQMYPQVEGPGNPGWEARNPQLDPQAQLIKRLPFQGQQPGMPQQQPGIPMDPATRLKFDAMQKQATIDAAGQQQLQGGVGSMKPIKRVDMFGQPRVVSPGYGAYNGTPW